METFPFACGEAGELLSLDHRLTCACETNGLQVEVSWADFLLLYCPRCQLIVAGQPVTDDAGATWVRLLALSEEEANEVRWAVRLVPDRPLVEVLELMLSCTLPAALRVAQERLGRRKGLIPELRLALYGSEERVRLLALVLVSRMGQVPEELRQPALHAIQMNLGLDCDSEEVLVALTALYPLAAEGRALRPLVEQIVSSIAWREGERPTLISRICQAVLAAFDRPGPASPSG